MKSFISWQDVISFKNVSYSHHALVSSVFFLVDLYMPSCYSAMFAVEERPKTQPVQIGRDKLQVFGPRT